MLRVIGCLTTQHDWRLVLLAGGVCFLTSIAAINLFFRARATTGRARVWWLTTTGAAAGYGIWATHFIAMLAFAPGLPSGYDLPLTVLSLLAAAIMTAVGFTIAVNVKTSWAAPLSGTVIGLGIAVMHYTGMSAFQVPGHVEWATDLVVTSIVLAVLFGTLSIQVALRSHGPRTALLSALLFALAILAHHFTGMGAVEIVPDPAVLLSANALSLSPHSLSVAVASAAIAVLCISLFAIKASRSRQRLIQISDAKIAIQAEHLESALANMSQGLCMFDRDQRLVIANERYAEMYGLIPEQIRPGTTLREIVQARVERGVYGTVEATDVIKVMMAGFQSGVSEIVRLADGRFISVVRRPMADGGMVITHEDITERSNAQARIAHLAHHDVLTDLPNRALLHERLEQALTALNQGGRPLALLMLDLDRFKEVNDTLGHPIGDALLKAVAQRLLGCVREGDTIARLGGDEFAILQKTSCPAGDSVALAKRIQDVISEPLELEGHHVVVGTTIGIAIAPADGAIPDQLIKNADLALYRAKSKGRGTYRLFEPEMDRRMQARRTMEMDIRQALANRAFILHYQPLVNIVRDEISGFEALLRWHHPERGNIPPADFIPLAEETGLIVELGEWVLRQACTDATAWPENLKVAVNVSPAQFRVRNFADMVLRTLSATGLTPQRLELEITESAMLQDENAALAALRQLHDQGVRIALDDFGTGYSSLSNLRRFPFDKIKIDRSFVSDLSAANVDALAVVRSVAHLGASLGMAITAKGVETEEQLDYVRAEGCTEMQGFYICPPSSAKDIEKLILAKFGKLAGAA